MAARIKAEGGELVVTGRTPEGPWEQRVRVAPPGADDGSGGVLAALFGREAVEDAETRLAGGAPRDGVDALVEKLGLAYGIATRLTSWIAVDEVASVDPRAPTRSETVPQRLAHGLSVEGLGLRPAPWPAAGGMPSRARVARSTAAPPASPAAMKPPAPPPAMKKEEAGAQRKGFFRSVVDALRPRPAPSEVRARVTSSEGRTLVLDLEFLGAFDWDADALAAALTLVELENGRVVRGKVDLARTTRASRLAPGQHARLVVVLDDAPDAVAVFVTFEPDSGLRIPVIVQV